MTACVCLMMTILIAHPAKPHRATCFLTDLAAPGARTRCATEVELRVADHLRGFVERHLNQ